MKKYISLALSCLATLTLSCDSFILYNPNEINLDRDERNLSEMNIKKIQAIPLRDTLKFILMGDTQRWYDESADFVKSANSQKDIAFVLHAGDISDFGINQEFKWVNEIMVKLNSPYLTVIGNHDIVANGPISYRKMYGSLDYSFDYGNHRFVFINTNSREYAFDGTVPNLSWLKSQLSNNPENKNIIVIGHVPPFDGDFDKKLEKDFSDLLGSNPNVKMSLYGHKHSFNNGEFYNDGVHYYVTTSMGARGYWVVRVWKDGYYLEKIEF
ncbi:metallophosphoesterase family protein [Dyadobacter arcticus]|uniref:3',5'-cyclic AMP phosphodiesterase CpdA n=1 Tax=Dyadobacter arcticus TaxID=1078754 RepID=A0ABX0URD5_9BACT|nr:metallophosphoesterase [Dyadobacter arcticus]NIJ54170.1 3',5'-cyclic AMP phosphodiesterase CpdA [Dyadobacter arcticus]